MHLLSRVALALLLSAALWPAAARAAGPVFHVNSVADVPDAVANGVCETLAGNGVCTLRAAVMEASFSSSFLGQEATIDLPAGTYSLTRQIVTDDDSDGDLNIYGTVRILGAGYDLSIISASNFDRVMTVSAGAVVTLSDIRVQGGRPPASAVRSYLGNGGGIAGSGTLTLVRCLVRNNQLASSTGSEAGAGIYWDGSSLTLIDSVVRVNGTVNGTGGGIHALSTDTTILRSIVHSNGASIGGGVSQKMGSLKIVDSTIGQNSATVGGGLYLDHVTGVQLNNVTVAENTTSSVGQAANVFQSTVILSNSIVSGQLDCSTGSITSNGFNLLTNGTACPVTGTVLFAGAGLGALGDNGGPTVTYPLLAGSVARDAGNPAGCLDAFGAALATDQRGVLRQIGLHCDLGAFEVEPIGDANGDGIVSVSDVFYLVNFLFAGGPVPKGRGNVNGVPGIDVTDVFYLINFLFAGGSAPA